MGRLSGLIRELVIVNQFGFTSNTDIAIIFLTLPDFLIGVLLTGGLTAILIPSFQSMPYKNINILFTQLNILVFCIFFVISLIIFFNPKILLSIFAPGISFSINNNFLISLFFIASSIPFTAITGISGAMLNYKNKFFIVGCGTLIFNISVIGFIFLGFFYNKPLLYLSIGVFVGSVLRWSSQFLLIIKSVHLSFLNVNLISWRLIKNFFYAFLGSSVLVLVPIFTRSIVSFFGEGYIATFNFASKVVEVPIILIVISGSTTAYPKIVSLLSKGKKVECDIFISNRINFIIGSSMTIILTGFFYSEGIISFLLFSQETSSSEIIKITNFVNILLLSMPFVGFSTYMTLILNAKHVPLKVLFSAFPSLIVMFLALYLSVVIGREAIFLSSYILFFIMHSIILSKINKVNFFGINGFFSFKTIICFLMPTFTCTIIMLLSNYFSLLNKYYDCFFSIISILISLILIKFYLENKINYYLLLKFLKK